MENRKNANQLFGVLNQKSKKQHSPKPISDEENDYEDKGDLGLSQRKANLKRRLQTQGPKGKNAFYNPFRKYKILSDSS